MSWLLGVVLLVSWPVAAAGLESTFPYIDVVIPSTFDECSTVAERQITVSGGNFQGASLLIDGAVVPATVTENEIAFSAPPLAGGLYDVRVVSPSGRSSEGHALFVDSEPEIHSVTEGPDRVTSYDVIITGRNFFYVTVLAVDGAPVTTASSEHRPPGESLTYVDCNTLIYHRYPYSRVPKDVTLQVVNPEGRESPLLLVTIP